MIPLGEGPMTDETKPSIGLAGGWVSKTCWPNLSKAADRSRNISTAVLARIPGSEIWLCSYNNKNSKKEIKRPYLSIKKTYPLSQIMTLFSIEDWDVLDLVCVSSILFIRRKIPDFLIILFIHPLINSIGTQIRCYSCTEGPVGWDAKRQTYED